MGAGKRAKALSRTRPARPVVPVRFSFGESHIENLRGDAKFLPGASIYDGEVRGQRIWDSPDDRLTFLSAEVPSHLPMALFLNPICTPCDDTAPPRHNRHRRS
jgi:hypothetical protein